MSRRFRRHVACVLAAAGGGLLALGGSTAIAAEGSVSGSTLVYLADKGEANDVVVSGRTNTLTIADAGAAIVPGDGCAPVPDDPHAITCSAAGVTGLSLIAGDRDDRLRNDTGLPAQLAGGRP